MASRYPDENWETESNNTTDSELSEVSDIKNSSDSELSEVSDSNNTCGK